MPYVDAAGGDKSALVSTSGLLDDEKGVVLLRPGDETRGPLATDAETAARAAAALASGHVLVVPRAVLQ